MSSETLFTDRVNAVSALISNMTADPSERFGIASVLCEIYRHNLLGFLSPLSTKGAENEVEESESDKKN